MSANHGGASSAARLASLPLFGPVWALRLHGGRKKGPIDTVTETILKPRTPTLPLAFGGYGKSCTCMPTVGLIGEKDVSCLLNSVRLTVGKS